MKIGLKFLAHSAKGRCRGAVTVEYAIIFPIVIICIIILIYLGLLYYQQSLMQAVVSESVQNWALLWGYDPKGVDAKAGITNQNTYFSEGLYWHIFPNLDEREKNVVDTIKNELITKSILRPIGDINVETKCSNLLIYKKVGFRAKAIYPLPFKGLLRLIGSSGNITMEAYSETIINDPKEFIQNIDYLLQIYEETGVKDWVTEECEPLVNTLQKIKAYFK